MIHFFGQASVFGIRSGITGTSDTGGMDTILLIIGVTTPATIGDTTQVTTGEAVTTRPAPTPGPTSEKNSSVEEKCIELPQRAEE